MSLTRYNYNSINEVPVKIKTSETEFGFDEKDIFVKIGQIIYKNNNIEELYNYQDTISKLVSDMTIVTSQINKLKIAERNNINFDYQVIVEGKSLIRKEINEKIDNFINYLRHFYEPEIDNLINDLLVIFNNIKEENLVREYTCEIYSDAENQLHISKSNIQNYISYIQFLEYTHNTKHHKRNTYLESVIKFFILYMCCCYR